MTKFSQCLLTTLCTLAPACSTCPPCVPTHEIVEVFKTVSSCPPPAVLPPLVLPPWPILPDDATPAETKTWYVDVVETINARAAIRTDRIDALGEILASYKDDG